MLEAFVKRFLYTGQAITNVMQAPISELRNMVYNILGCLHKC